MCVKNTKNIYISNGKVQDLKVAIGEQGQAQILWSGTLISNIGWSEFSFKRLFIYFQAPLSEILIPQVWGE